MINSYTESKKKTIIISGVNGDIGQEFARCLLNEGKLYGISRSGNKTGLQYSHICADLLNPEDVKSAFSQIDYSEDLLYVHLPGKFRYEDDKHPIKDADLDGVDDEIYATNVTTFRNVKPYLLDYLKNNKSGRLKIIAIGSTSDIYDIPFWHSFTHAKNELRKEFRRLYGHPETYGRVSCLFINVSTTDGRQLETERPFISKRYCLTPNEVLAQALPYILDDKPSSLELTVIKPNPSFAEPNYLSYDQVKNRWYSDMYGNSSIQQMKGGKE